jgi:hypothetical protein
MKTQTHKAYLYFDTRSGEHQIYACAGMDETFPEEYVFLAAQDVEFQIEKTDAELTQAQIDRLNEAKQNILAETEMKAAAIDQKIQSLLAITHEPA